MTRAAVASHALLALALLAVPSRAWSQQSPPAAGQPVAPWGAAPAPAAPPPPPGYAQPVYPQPVYAQPIYPEAIYPQPIYPQASPTSGVPVRFVAHLAGDRYTVSVSTPSGPQQCAAPCALTLLPGEYAVTVTGEASYTDTISVQASPLLVRIRRYRASRMIWGAAGSGVGAAIFVAGLVLSGECEARSSFSSSCDTPVSALWLMLIGSALGVTAATTGFTTMGSNRLAATVDYNFYAQRRAPRLIGLGAAPAAGGGATVGATLSF